ncbi:hypothetical protein [Phocaeicola vulgatus]|uniref:hypothetical protein n=2 Tax=Phocaeicola vulgatus TaxID=821 RepID=UPI0035639C9C
MDLNNIVGFKAVDKNGNERQVTVDEMTELVSARIVSAASEISTFAAAAAAGTDEFEDQLPQSDTFSWLRTLDGSKNPTLTSSSAAAKVLGELLPTASNEKKGLMPAGGVSRIPYFRYSSDNVYKLEYPFYGIVGGHSDRTNTTSLYVMEVDRIYKIYATSGNTISFKKDSDRNVYASGGDGGFMFYVIPFNGRIVEVYSGDISNFEQISVL